MTSAQPPTHDLVSFDLDGTLVDTAGEIADAVNRCLTGQGLPPRPEAEIVALIGNGAHALMHQLLAQMRQELRQALRQEIGQDAGPENPAQSALMLADALMPDFEAHYAITAGTTSQPYPGASAALRQLRARGVKLACVTNKELRHAQRVLQAHGLTALFDLVIGGDSLAEKKPHGSVLQHVASTLGVPLGRVAHVGDSATDVAAARHAGVAAWAVPYGYNAGVPISDSRPDIVFNSLQAVADHVTGHSPAAGQ